MGSWKQMWSVRKPYQPSDVDVDLTHLAPVPLPADCGRCSAANYSPVRRRSSATWVASTVWPSLNFRRWVPNVTRLFFIMLVGLALMMPGCTDHADQPVYTLDVPPGGSLYHGVFPGTESGFEDDISIDRLKAYTNAVGKSVSWVYFSSEWGRSRRFPSDTCNWIRAEGAVPYIRLMLRTHFVVNTAEKLFTGERILAGDFDADLRNWARGAKAYAQPIIVEYGTECNGYWFPWNGRWLRDSGTGANDPVAQRSGPARFVAIYRHIISLMREEGANNITWVFHISSVDDPQEEWNRFEHYYPGDDYIDWIGLTVYGAQSPLDTGVYAFRQQFTPAYNRVQAMAPSKPVILAEFGCSSGAPGTSQAAWTEGALQDMLAGRWPNVIGFSWWNSSFANDDNPAHDTILRVEQSPALQRVMRRILSDPRVLGAPVLRP